jgi:CheY-like chemotaxis protein
VPALPLILVIEDEYFLQVEVSEALTAAGFAVEAVASGEDALRLFASGKPYKAVATDIHLRGDLNGWDVARRIREMGPSFPIVYMTGTEVGQWASQGVPNTILLEKPFAPAQLVTAISNLLNVGTGPTS